MALGKKNKVSLAIEDYTHLIIGAKKIGKSSLFANIAQTYYGLDHALCISMGDEDGHKLIDDLTFENPQNWKEFVNIVDELTNHPDDNDFKIISIDTIDVLVEMATKEVMRLHQVDTMTPCKSINDAFGGYGRGRERLCNLLSEQLEKLRRSKYGVFLIGHNKIRPQEDKDGVKFITLTSNLEAKLYDTFSYKADIVCNIDVEKEVGDQILNKDGSIRREGNLEGSQRYMYFRDNGYVDAGSRFEKIPNKVPYGAENYVNAVQEGIRAAAHFKGDSEEYEKRIQEDLKNREIRADERAKLNMLNDENEKRQELISSFRSGIGNSGNEQREKVKDLVKNWGYTDTNDLFNNSSIEQMKELVDIVSQNNYMTDSFLAN